IPAVAPLGARRLTAVRQFIEIEHLLGGIPGDCFDQQTFLLEDQLRTFFGKEVAEQEIAPLDVHTSKLSRDDFEKKEHPGIGIVETKKVHHRRLKPRPATLDEL